jgi:hypothetical protein
MSVWERCTSHCLLLWMSHRAKGCIALIEDRNCEREGNSWRRKASMLFDPGTVRTVHVLADGAVQLPANSTAILAGSIIVITASLRCLISVFILSALSSDLSVDWSDQTYGLYKKRNRHLSPSRIHDIHSICKWVYSFLPGRHPSRLFVAQ